MKIKILKIEPGKKPEIKEIEDGLKSLQDEVQGDIEAVYPFDDNVGIICNEEGKINGMALNRALYDDDGEMYDINAGPFLVVGLTEDSFSSLSDEIDDPVGTDDEEGLTWADIIPDTRDEDEKLERQEEERRSVLVSKMLAEIEKLPEDDKNLIFAMFLNPEKNMSEKEYAELLGISQQNVNKRKLKIFKKIRAAMGVKK